MLFGYTPPGGCVARSPGPEGLLRMTIDLEKLLAPLAENSPTGVDLRDASNSAVFTALEDLRREEDAALDDSEGKAANWPAVVRACEQTLNTQSKDLQLAAYLTEALAHIDGFAGMHAGLQVVRGLLDRYWDTLHPGAGEGAVEPGARVRWLSWLSSPSTKGFLRSVRAIRLFGDGSKREVWIPWEGFLEAQRLEAAAVVSQARHDEMIAAGAMTRERWNAAVAATKTAHLLAELEALKASESELLAIEGFCAARLASDDAPSFVELRGLLSEIREFIEGRLPSEVGGSVEGTVETGSGGSRAQALAGPIGSRSQALQRLREVAEFFRQSEPHSPLPHLIDRAVRWAGMSFEELLVDVMKNNDVLTPVWNTLGIKPPPPDPGA